MQNMISEATKKNWSRLHKQNNKKLTARANKRFSQKNIIPIEYFCNIKNKECIEQLLTLIYDKKWDIASVLLSLGINLLKKANLYQKNHTKEVLSEYHYTVISQLLEYPLPSDERDILGLLYQALLSEGKKNRAGSYYTPQKVTNHMTETLCFSNGETFFDPCCGSGAFFSALKGIQPKQIYGADKDNIAVMIAKINLLLQFREYEFIPQICCKDYLKENVFDIHFDYIVTNPPWGAISEDVNNIPEITSGETFSYFFVRSYQQLKEYGTIRFLFPESILNVKLHKDIRTFLLEKGRLNQITIYNELFTGVSTKYIDISFQKAKQNKKVWVCDEQTQTQFSISVFYKMQHKAFRFMNDMDIEIIKQVNEIGKYYLNHSIWALGIVTGDNKNQLKEHFFDGSEPIYTGKEVGTYRLRQAKKYIRYDREKLQQVAPEEYYRAKEKLAYKFISNKLVFCYDDTQSLFLNSANLLIPNIPHMSVKTVLAYLNSELFQYLYITMFGDVKILKGNLMLLPFPDITEKQNNDITKIVNELCCENNKNNELLQQMIYSTFHCTKKQIEYIKNAIKNR